MKTKVKVWVVSVLLVFLSLAIFPVSCDFAKPKKKFRLAVPKTEYFFTYIAGHLKPFLERKGYQISIVPADNILEANQMVESGVIATSRYNSYLSMLGGADNRK